MKARFLTRVGFAVMKIRPAGFQKPIFLGKAVKKLRVVFPVRGAKHFEAIEAPTPKRLEKFFKLVVAVFLKIGNWGMRPDRSAERLMNELDRILWREGAAPDVIWGFIREIFFKKILLCGDIVSSELFFIFLPLHYCGNNMGARHRCRTHGLALYVSPLDGEPFMHAKIFRHFFFALHSAFAKRLERREKFRIRMVDPVAENMNVVLLNGHLDTGYHANSRGAAGLEGSGNARARIVISKRNCQNTCVTRRLDNLRRGMRPV